MSRQKDSTLGDVNKQNASFGNNSCMRPGSASWGGCLTCHARPAWPHGNRHSLGVDSSKELLIATNADTDWYLLSSSWGGRNLFLSSRLCLLGLWVFFIYLREEHIKGPFPNVFYTVIHCSYAIALSWINPMVHLGQNCQLWVAARCSPKAIQAGYEGSWPSPTTVAPRYHFSTAAANVKEGSTG